MWENVAAGSRVAEKLDKYNKFLRNLDEGVCSRQQKFLSWNIVDTTIVLGR